MDAEGLLDLSVHTGGSPLVEVVGASAKGGGAASCSPVGKLPFTPSPLRPSEEDKLPASPPRSESPTASGRCEQQCGRRQSAVRGKRMRRTLRDSNWFEAFTVEDDELLSDVNASAVLAKAPTAPECTTTGNKHVQVACEPIQQDSLLPSRLKANSRQTMTWEAFANLRDAQLMDERLEQLEEDACLRSVPARDVPSATKVTENTLFLSCNMIALSTNSTHCCVESRPQAEQPSTSDCDTRAQMTEQLPAIAKQAAAVFTPALTTPKQPIQSKRTPSLETRTPRLPPLQLPDTSTASPEPAKAVEQQQTMADRPVEASPAKSCSATPTAASVAASPCSTAMQAADTQTNAAPTPSKLTPRRPLRPVVDFSQCKIPVARTSTLIQRMSATEATVPRSDSGAVAAVESRSCTQERPPLLEMNAAPVKAAAAPVATNSTSRLKPPGQPVIGLSKPPASSAKAKQQKQKQKRSSGGGENLYTEERLAALLQNEDEAFAKKGGRVANSPETPQTQPYNLWSPIRNQPAGPYDCTKRHQQRR
eukprot:jgi/Chlat1/1256/Chrsp115S01664